MIDLHFIFVTNLGNETSQYPLSCGTNANISRGYNQTGACACNQGFTGLNCAIIATKTLVALAALGAGLIALIVILALLGAAMCGGGAIAVYDLNDIYFNYNLIDSIQYFHLSVFLLLC
jgi:hypothetical protein